LLTDRTVKYEKYVTLKIYEAKTTTKEKFAEHFDVTSLMFI
jgi:hypothetical protein